MNEALDQTLSHKVKGVEFKDARSVDILFFMETIGRFQKNRSTVSLEQFKIQIAFHVIYLYMILSVRIMNGLGAELFGFRFNKFLYNKFAESKSFIILSRYLGKNHYPSGCKCLVCLSDCKIVN